MARVQLEIAYRLFDYAEDPAIIDEAIYLINAGELSLDRAIHPKPSETQKGD